MKLENFKQVFSQSPEKYPRSLEQYHPDILHRILSYWESEQALKQYLTSLLINNVQSDNTPLISQTIFQEIHFLSNLAEQWHRAKNKKAPIDQLNAVHPHLVKTLESQQKPLTPDLLQSLSHLKKLIQQGSLDGLMAFEPLFNQKDQDGLTPLMHAALCGSEHALLFLLKHASNPHMIDRLGNSALHWAVSMNQFRCMEILLYFNAPVLLENQAGKTALLLSVVKSTSLFTARLLDYGAHPNASNRYGQYPLHQAIEVRSLENIKTLLQYGASKDMMNQHRITAYQMAEKDSVIRQIFNEYDALFLKQNLFY